MKLSERRKIMIISRGIPTALITVIISLGLFHVCDAYKGLTHQRNFAHVYGKRTLPEPYFSDSNFDEHRVHPSEQGKDIDSLHERSNDRTVDVKGKVAHMFGRELYFNDYTPEDILGILVTEYDEEKLPRKTISQPAVPKVRNRDMIDIPNQMPTVGAKGSPDDSFNAGQRSVLQNILQGNGDKYMEMIRYLND